MNKNEINLISEIERLSIILCDYCKYNSQVEEINNIIVLADCIYQKIAKLYINNH